MYRVIIPAGDVVADGAPASPLGRRKDERHEKPGPAHRVRRPARRRPVPPARAPDRPARRALRRRARAAVLPAVRRGGRRFRPGRPSRGRSAAGHLERCLGAGGGGVDPIADLVVNHVSVESPEFLDVLARGEESPWAPMFLTFGSVFPFGATEEELLALYRPRPGLPFTPMRLGSRRRLVWTTFTAPAGRHRRPLRAGPGLPRRGAPAAGRPPGRAGARGRRRLRGQDAGDLVLHDPGDLRLHRRARRGGTLAPARGAGRGALLLPAAGRDRAAGRPRLRLRAPAAGPARAARRGRRSAATWLAVRPANA